MSEYTYQVNRSDGYINKFKVESRSNKMISYRNGFGSIVRESIKSQSHVHVNTYSEAKMLSLEISEKVIDSLRSRLSRMEEQMEAVNKSGDDIRCSSRLPRPEVEYTREELEKML